VARTITSAGARKEVQLLVRLAVRNGMPREAADYAAAATMSAIDRARCQTLADVGLAAYFDKVGRRRVVRRHGGSRAAARVVADCVVADLLGAGRSGEDVYRELARGWTAAASGTARLNISSACVPDSAGARDQDVALGTQHPNALVLELPVLRPIASTTTHAVLPRTRLALRRKAPPLRNEGKCG